MPLTERAKRAEYVRITYLLPTYYFLDTYYWLNARVLSTSYVIITQVCSCACLKYPTIPISHLSSSQVVTCKRASRSLSVRFFLAVFGVFFRCGFRCRFFFALGCVQERFQGQHSPNLGPFWGSCWTLFGTFLRAALASSFKIVFMTIFGRFWTLRKSKKHWKTNGFLTFLLFLLLRSWDRFWTDFGSILGPKIDQKWIQKAIPRGIETRYEKSWSKKSAAPNGATASRVGRVWAQPSGTPISNDSLFFFL